jgi:hypothetical protein
MSNGLLAWWRRWVASSGLAGAVMCAVPVAVAALIAFGTGISGITAGLAAVTSGPSGGSDTISSASAQTDPSGLNRAVLRLASNSVGSSSDARSTAPGTGGGSKRDGTVVGTGGSGGGSSGQAVSGSGGSGGGSSTSPTNGTPGTDAVNNTVNNTVDSVGNTVDSVGSTVDSVGGTVDNTLDSVNNTLGGAGSTVNGLLNP